MEQTTSLNTKIFESSLRWNIEHFLDYSACCVEKIKSKEIKFTDTNASWFLEIWPPLYDSIDGVKIAFALNDSEASGQRLFSAQIRVDGEGHHLQSPANRHLVKQRGFYADPEIVPSPTWVLDYQPNIQKSFEMENFIAHNSLETFLNGGTLTINAKVREDIKNLIESLSSFCVLGLHQNC